MADLTKYMVKINYNFFSFFFQMFTIVFTDCFYWIIIFRHCKFQQDYTENDCQQYADLYCSININLATYGNKLLDPVRSVAYLCWKS